jgi:hypothetical protein
LNALPRKTLSFLTNCASSLNFANPSCNQPLPLASSASWTCWRLKRECVQLSRQLRSFLANHNTHRYLVNVRLRERPQFLCTWRWVWCILARNKCIKLSTNILLPLWFCWHTQR